MPEPVQSFREAIADPDSVERSPCVAARAVTAAIVGVPFVAVLVGAVHRWGTLHARDVVIAAISYLAIGHGVTIGFHRLLAHRSFVAKRPLKLVVVALGSMAFQGGPIGWVAAHRRHHVFADVPGDPHSPRRRTPGTARQRGGLWHAHLGWLFTNRAEPSRRRAADLLADRDLVVMNALFPLWCAVSLGVPFALGWLLGGTVGAALSALIWGGFFRVFLLQHITWSVNSFGHRFGRRPFATDDSSTNIAALSLISMGESWHNGHHAFPRSARHGLLTGQCDSSARLIHLFERLGWVTDIHQPPSPAVEARRRDRPPSPPT